QWEQDLRNLFGKDTTAKDSTADSMTAEGGLMSGQAAVAVADPGLEGVEIEMDGEKCHLKHGSVVIAAITSCTNTSNPSVMIGAGLHARHAVAKGVKRKPSVKASLAPGSRVVTDYLQRSGLDKPLD